MTRLSQKVISWILLKGENLEDELYGAEKNILLDVKSKSKVLEIGPGTGINLKYYPKNINWIGLEPNPEMTKHIKIKIKEQGINAVLLNGSAEKIPLKNNSIDYVISTLVLCSVNNPLNVVKEIKRVLKSSGKFLFIEHVADEKGTFRRVIQNMTNYTPWRFFSDGCHPNRETWKIIEHEFKNVEVKKYFLKNGGFFTWIVKPHIIGKAEK